jgi:hypothetical protein
MQPARSIQRFLAWLLLPLLALVACGSPVESKQGDLGQSNSTCGSLARDACLKTIGCFLDYGGQPDSYFCRPVRNDCELRTNDGGQSACEAAGHCAWMPGSCYCPEGMLCFCGGGPPPMCRAA